VTKFSRRICLALPLPLLIPEPTRVYSFLWAEDEAAYRRRVIEQFRRECIEEWERIARRPMSARITVGDLIRQYERAGFSLSPLPAASFIVIER
jgi:hypothetical protein